MTDPYTPSPGVTADLIDREAAIEAVIAALPSPMRTASPLWVSAREAIVAVLRTLPGVTP